MPIMVQKNKTKLMCEGRQIAKMYCERNIIYSSGNIVTYMVDASVSYQEEVDEGDSCLSPKTFTPAKAGWTFLGWRQDNSASAAVINSLVMGDEPVTLYAVFQQTITLSYNGNGNTGGATAAQTGTRYYNTGNYSNPSFSLQANGFSRSGYIFSKWALGSAGGTQYSAGATVTLSGNTTFYAVWVADKTSYRKYNGNQLTVSSTFGENLTSGSSKVIRQYKDTPAHLNGSITVTLPISLKSSDTVRFNYEINAHLITVGVVSANISIDGLTSYGIDTNSKQSKNHSASNGQTTFTIPISGNAEEADDDDATMIFTWSILSVEINP